MLKDTYELIQYMEEKLGNGSHVDIRIGSDHTMIFNILWPSERCSYQVGISVQEMSYLDEDRDNYIIDTLIQKAIFDYEMKVRKG